MTTDGGGALTFLVADGEASFATSVADSLEAVSNAVTAEAIASPTELIDQAMERDVDAVLIGDQLDSPTETIDRMTNGSDRPIVLLTDGTTGELIPGTVEVGVWDILPRTTVESQFELFIRRFRSEYGTNGESGRHTTDSDQARRDTERAYRAVFENVSDGLVVHDAETGEIIDVNERFCEMNGYERDELVGEDIGIVTAPAEKYSYEAAHEKIEMARTEGPQLFEWRNQHRSGETFPVEVHLSVVRLHGEQHVLASVRDISERKQREREYEQIFNGVNDSIVVHDPETGEMVDANETFCELLGYDRETVLELGTAGVSVQEEGFTEERAEEIISQVMDGETKTLDWMVETRGGERRHLEVTATAIEIEGEPRHVSLMRDVTERRRREREYEQIFNGVQDGLQLMDPDTLETIDVNEAYLDMFGYDSVDDVREAGVEGMSLTEEGFTFEQGREIHQRVTETGDPEIVEWHAETADGEDIWLELKVTPAVIGGEELNIVVHRDITERKRRQRLIRNLHTSTDSLQNAETVQEVCEATVSAAREVLDLSMSTCWLHNPDDADVLTPVAATDEAWDLQIDGGWTDAFEPGDFEYEVYAEDDMRVYDPSDLYGDTPLDHAAIIPLDDHGLFGAAEPGVETFGDVTLDAAQILTQHATTALNRVDRARELRQSERRFRLIAEHIDEIIYLANADLTDVQYVNPAYAEVFGRPVEELYEDARAFLEAVHPEDRASYEADIEVMLEDIEAGDTDDRYEFEFRIQRPDGETRWLESTGYPILTERDDPHQFVGVTKDVTAQRRREQTLETFHEATRKLTEVDSRKAACRHAVTAAEDILGFPLVSAFLYDDTTGRLEPTAITSRLDDLDVDLPTFGPGESLAWDVYVEGDAVTSSDMATDVYGPGVSAPDVVLPLGSHGVMLVGAPTDDFDATDIELAQILAATLEAALNHVAEEQTLKEREAELRRQQERATQLERLNTIIRDIEQVTVEQSSRTGIEEAVCERLIDVETHDLVWIAEPAVGDDELVPRTSTGGNESYMDALSVEIDTAASGHPAVPAYRRDTPHVIENVATDVTTGEWRTTALRHGIQSVIAVPIQHETTTHGVLTVASEEPDAFDEATRTVLAELGRSIGYAITVTEREQALESEGTTELEFAIEDDGLFLVRGSVETDCRTRLERTIRRTGGSFSMFYAVEDASPDELVELANAAPSVETAQVVSVDEDAEGGLIEVTAPTWFGSVFTEHGAVVREASANDGTGTLVVEAPRGADVRTLVEGFQERYPDTELLAQRQRERTISSLFELQDALQADLTDRQWEALETAYSAGYFAWPRETSGEEVAELIDVTQPTFNKHLRIAERTAFRMLLDREYPDSEA